MSSPRHPVIPSSRQDFPSSRQTEKDRQLVTFWLAGRLYGVEIALVKEVTTVSPLTRIPHAPAAVRGAVNLRGQIHLVLDPCRMLRAGATEVRSETRLVLFHAALGDPFGILVDRVGDIVRLPGSAVDMAGAAEGAGNDRPGLVTGVGKLDGVLVTLLDAHGFLAAAATTNRLQAQIPIRPAENVS